MRSFYIHTFGCQMNVHDSMRMHELLSGAGFVQIDDPDTADLIVLNTCSVREKAEQKLDSELGKMRLVKLHREKKPVIAVTGCVARQRGERMIRRMPFIDLVLGPDNLGELAELAEAAANGAAPVVRTEFDMDAPAFLRSHSPSKAVGPSSFVAISKGCDERCTFCIVPSTRGPERHRSSAQIVEEISRLVDAGTREVVLLGQTVNGYFDPSGEVSRIYGRGELTDGDTDFAGLLRFIASEVKGLARLRYTSPHPRYYGPSVVEAHRDLDVLCRHIHMPVQSGSDAVLKRMLRRYTREEYLSTVRSLRSARPDMTVSTDIIVGFPGETDDDLTDTLTLMMEARFLGAYSFKYSPRPGTPALRLPDDVPEEVKAERLAKVFEVSDDLQASYLASLIGSEQKVLIEAVGARGDLKLQGHTDRNEIVHVVDAGGPEMIGQIVSVRVTRAFRHSVEAELLSAPSRASSRRLPVINGVG